jgi:uncharacterized RDD family membrane protein YckC
MLIVTTTLTVLAALIRLVEEALPLGDLSQGLLTLVLASSFFVVSYAYYVGFWLLVGQTIGKRIMGVRVVRTDGTRLGFVAATVRLLGYLASAILFLGFLWVIIDNRRQGWHDKLAGTMVVYAWPEPGDTASPTLPVLHTVRTSRKARPFR